MCSRMRRHLLLRPSRVREPDLGQIPSRIPAPWHPEPQEVRHATARIQPRANQRVDHGVACFPFNPPDDVLVQHILGEVPTHADSGRDHQIDSALGSRIQADVADGRVADGAIEVGNDLKRRYLLSCCGR